MDNRLDTTAGRIRFLRKKAGLKQEQLGEKLNVGKTTISNYENGVSKPQGKRLIELANFFRVSTDYILASDVGSLQERPGVSIPKSVAVPILIHLEQGAYQENIECYVELPTTLNPEGDYLAWRVDTEFPGGKIDKDDIVIILKTKEYQNGDMIVGIIGKEKTVIGNYCKAADSLVNCNSKCEKFCDDPTIVQMKNREFKMIGKVVAAIVSF